MSVAFAAGAAAAAAAVLLMMTDFIMCIYNQGFFTEALLMGLAPVLSRDALPRGDLSAGDKGSGK